MHPPRAVLRFVLVTAAALIAGLLAPGRMPLSAGIAPQSMWVELGPDGLVIARVVTTTPGCPDITLDGRAQPMAVRARPNADFDVLVCEAAVPPGTVAASVAGEPLPLPAPNPRRILVLGDTGCRLEGDRVQACNDPAAWPFAQVAAAATAWQPDLVIHVGDYHYLESPCPPGNAGCAGHPYGDIWPSWNADFFLPAAPLLRAAPWVVVRGNHETCSRAGAGWFRLLDPRPPPVACQDYTEPYVIPVAGVSLFMLDSAIVDDYKDDPSQVTAYRGQFERLTSFGEAPAWVVTHQPLWVFGHAAEKDGEEQLFRDTGVLQDAARDLLPAGLQLVLSGHIHLVEILSFAGGRVPQLITGNGGTELDQQVTTPLDGLTIDGDTVAAGTMIDRFGFMTLVPEGGGWTATLRDVDGVPLTVCAVRGRSAACAP